MSATLDFNYENVSCLKKELKHSQQTSVTDPTRQWYSSICKCALVWDFWQLLKQATKEYTELWIFFLFFVLLQVDYLTNLLKTAVSVLASTVRLTVSFMDPLMTVSVMLRCSQHNGSSSPLNFSQSSSKFEDEEATLVPNHSSEPIR